MTWDCDGKEWCTRCSLGYDHKKKDCIDALKSELEDRTEDICRLEKRVSAGKRELKRLDKVKAGLLTLRVQVSEEAIVSEQARVWLDAIDEIIGY